MEEHCRVAVLHVPSEDGNTKVFFSLLNINFSCRPIYIQIIGALSVSCMHCKVQTQEKESKKLHKNYNNLVQLTHGFNG
jgi:hypothetical protein